jgi:hypothetical protein
MACSSWSATRKTRSEKWSDPMRTERDSTVEGATRSDEGQPQPDRSPPPDRPGELGAPSRAESRRVAKESGQTASDTSTGTADDRKPKDTPTTPQKAPGQRPDTEDRGEQTLPENGESETAPPDDTEQRRTDQAQDSPFESLEQRPSYGNFANLAEEFEARVESREQAE